MLHLLEQHGPQLQAWFAERGLGGYRAGQVRRWLFQRRAGGFDEMTDLPKTVRQQLAGEFQIWTARIAARRQAEDGTEKLLLELADAERTECVLLRDDREHCAVCISTQVGCAMRCAFCASGLGGLVRNLTSGEIVEQMLHLQRLLGPEERLSHVVVMGMGEPLLNLEGLLPALAEAAAPDGLGISARRITISTVGLPEGIRRMADENLQYHLAVSLHAADNGLRDRLVPANRGVGTAALLAAADEYFAKTGRRVTFEYVLLGGINDGAEHARQLVALLRGRPALVNVIPYNPAAGLPFRAPRRVVAERFAAALADGGLTVHVRRRKGSTIEAACGQLRRDAATQPPSADTFAP
jgi:23S rRNA (adenine2503-C2)-methyltransferase